MNLDGIYFRDLRSMIGTPHWILGLGLTLWENANKYTKKGKTHI